MNENSKVAIRDRERKTGMEMKIQIKRINKFEEDEKPEGGDLRTNGPAQAI